MALSRLPSKIANFFHSRVLNAPDEGAPLGIWYRRKGSRMLLWWRYQMVKKVLR